jgi:hypothetical protein
MGHQHAATQRGNRKLTQPWYQKTLPQAFTNIGTLNTSRQGVVQ